MSKAEQKKRERQSVYRKYDGHCAYCGREITFKEMQVDHIFPKCSNAPDIERLSNKNPSCRRCNHYKRAETLENFRRQMKTLHERVGKIYIAKVAIDYGIVQLKPFDGKFYFERLTEGGEG